MKKIIEYFNNKKRIKEVSNSIFREFSLIIENTIYYSKKNIEEDWNLLTLKNIEIIEEKWFLFMEPLLFLIWLLIEKNDFSEKNKVKILSALNSKIINLAKKWSNKSSRLIFLKKEIENTYKFYSENLIEKNYKECSNKLISKIITKEDYDMVSKDINLYLYIKLYVNEIFNEWEKLINDNYYNKNLTQN